MCRHDYHAHVHVLAGYVTMDLVTTVCHSDISTAQSSLANNINKCSKDHIIQCSSLAKHVDEIRIQGYEGCFMSYERVDS